jgi:hypothetical protein
MGVEFRCQTCGEVHKGMPRFGAVAPLSYYAIPATCVATGHLVQLGRVPKLEVAVASGLFNMLRNLGGAFRTALLATIVTK